MEGRTRGGKGQRRRRRKMGSKNGGRGTSAFVVAA